MDEKEPRICLDCSWHSKEPKMSVHHPNYCIHFTKEYWEAQGYESNWGDAAVTYWPKLEILRRKTSTKVEYIILAPDTGVRRPVHLFAELSLISWGSF